MIKVLLVSSDSNIGGAGTVILNYLGACDREKFDIGVVLPPNSLLKPQVEKLGYKTYEVEGIAEKSLSFSSVGTLKKLLKELKPDVVHTHASMSARIAARLCGVKAVVYTRHTVYPPAKYLTCFPGKQINGIVNSLTADAIIAVADAARENLNITGVSNKKISVILNGTPAPNVLDDAQKQKERDRFGVKENQRVVALVSRIEWGKGHEYFIDTAHILKDRGLDVKFIAAGTGSLIDENRKRVSELGLDGAVDFVGFVSDIQNLSNIIDLEVNCSYGCEATSMALIEALSLGKPCVVTRSGGNPGVVSDGYNGYVVTPENPEEMADKIEMLLTDGGQYARMSANASKSYEEKFTSKVMAQNTEKLYLNTLKIV